MDTKQRELMLEALMAKEIDGLAVDQAMELIGQIIDVGGDEQSLAALDHADGLLTRLMGVEGKPFPEYRQKLDRRTAPVFQAIRDIGRSNLERSLVALKTVAAIVAAIELRRSISHHRRTLQCASEV